jgi:hypothetical protein
MKTQRFLAIMAMAATIGVAMTACNDKEKDSPFAGTYTNVYLLATTPDGSMEMAYDTVEVTIQGKEGENLTLQCSTTLTVPQMSALPLNLNLNLSNITVNPLDANQAGFKIAEQDVSVSTLSLKVKGTNAYTAYTASLDGGLAIVGTNKTIDFKASASMVTNGVASSTPTAIFTVSSVSDSIRRPTTPPTAP